MTFLEETPALSPPMQNSSSPKDLEPEDAQKIRQWQNERQARQLRGEYESAVVHLTELINHNGAMSLRAVKVEGAYHTRSSFLGFLINPVLAEPGIHDVDGVLQKTRQIANTLQRTEIFKSVVASIEKSRDPMAGPLDVDLILNTVERGRIFVKTGAEFGSSDVEGNFTARVQNALGGGETLEAQSSLSSDKKRFFSVLGSAPISPDLATRAELSLTGLQRDSSSFSSCTETLRGLKALVRNGAILTGMNELAYEAVLRNIGGLAPAASISMRESAGMSTKSSISHVFLRDTRDSSISATRGMYLKTRNELAGLGGDAYFYKTEADAHASRALFPGVSGSVALRSGAMWGLGRPTLFSDRFQLGGPTSVRSIRTNGLGPHDGADSLGGDIFWSGGLSVISDVPKKPQWPVKLHSWLNFGRLDSMDKSKSFVDNVKATLLRPSVTAGVGLIYSFDPARIELNIGVPLVASASDSTRRGIQVGMGIEFL